MSIESGAQELCQKGLDFRRHGGEMDHEGRGGLGEEGYNFAVYIHQE